MKKWLLPLCLFYIFTGCNTAINSTPKDSLSKFLAAMTANNYEEAKDHATNASQALLNMLEKNAKGQENMYANKRFEITNVTISDNTAKAVVKTSSGGQVTFSLKVEHNDWKVDFTMAAILDMATEQLKTEGIDIKKEVGHALDSIKINLDSLP